ncbi:hypothetical protein H072_6516 [Dactylellina haptotyla CBS 200.50]|uniref:THIF-type NAD/FAD binding fold domain-containing protein n=1 Tax=Dactylellina haptotyla (strain CBS 200.50) TaxID=1284197 RepID=S8AEV6_DACHA|nr:hypothetical protein H072_6516 [Dactylellina haptotyla CBS 200.50]
MSRHDELPPDYTFYSSSSSPFPATALPPSPGAPGAFYPAPPHRSSKTRSKDRDRTFDSEGAAGTASPSGTKERKHKSRHKPSSSKDIKDTDKPKKKKKRSKKPRESTSSGSEKADSDAESVMSAFSMQSVSSSLSTFAQSHRAQLAATALVSGLVVGGTILGYQTSKRRIRTKMLKDSIALTPEHEGEDPMERSIDLSHWLAHSASPASASRDGPPSYASITQPVTPTTIRGAPSNPHAEQSTPGERPPITDEQSTALAKHAQSLAAKNKPIPEELILEQLSRTNSFLGSGGLRTIRSSFVVIVGLGGVGSWCATMLVRSGIGRVRLIDFDQVTLSSLNRHAVATLEDVGTPKVLAMKKRLQAVAPWVEIEACSELWTAKDAKRLLDDEPDWVVDAIDNIDTKVDLLAYCHEQRIPVISSMGAGCKSDPTRILVGDISETTEDPLSKSTRRKLRQRGIATGITVVYSTEKPGPGKAQLLPLPDEEHDKGDVSELGVLENFRVRILPVLGTMPATFGLAAANHVLCKLAEYPLEYLPGQTRFRPQLYPQVVNQLLAVESRIRNNVPGLKIPISEADAGYILEEVFNGKSVVSGLGNRLQLVRWSPLIGGRFEDGSTGTEGVGPVDEKAVKKKMENIGVGVGGAVSLKLEELVVMTREEIKIHEKRVLVGGESPEAVWGSEVQKLVERKWREERPYAQWRE